MQKVTLRPKEFAAPEDDGQESFMGIYDVARVPKKRFVATIKLPLIPETWTESIWFWLMGTAAVLLTVIWISTRP